MAVPKSFSGHFADVVVLKKLFGEDATKASIPRNYIKKRVAVVQFAAGGVE